MSRERFECILALVDTSAISGRTYLSDWPAKELWGVAVKAELVPARTRRKKERIIIIMVVWR